MVGPRRRPDPPPGRVEASSAQKRSTARGAPRGAAPSEGGGWGWGLASGVAAHYGDSEEELEETLGAVSGAVFNRLLVFMLREVPAAVLFTYAGLHEIPLMHVFPNYDAAFALGAAGQRRVPRHAQRER